MCLRHRMFSILCNRKSIKKWKSENKSTRPPVLNADQILYVVISNMSIMLQLHHPLHMPEFGLSP